MGVIWGTPTDEATFLTLDTNPLSSRHYGRARIQDARIGDGVDAA